MALLGGARDRRRDFVRRRGNVVREYDGRGRGCGRCARPAFVAGALLHLDRVCNVGCHEPVGLFRRPGDRQAVVPQGVAPQPLVGEAGRVVRPRAVRLGEGHALQGSSCDRGRGLVRWRGRNDRRGCAGARRAARAGPVARGLRHLDRVADVAREENIGLAGGAGDGGAVRAFVVAPQPLVGEAGRFIRPFAGVRGQGLVLLGGP